MSFFPEDNETPRINMNGRQKLFILAIDIAIVVELCIAMASAAANPETFTPSFVKPFFSMFTPTILIGFIGFRRLRDRAENAAS
ncbi:MAG: hypothetical protein KKF77_12655 [Proteobacteria bacterium]|nr:hypothetical protein [Pseudomonadota bacterium]